MHDDETYTGSSAESYEDAVRNALPPLSGNTPEAFEVTLGVSHGGYVALPQFTVTLRRLLEQPGEPPVR